MRIYLLELTGYDTATASVATAYFSTKGYTDTVSGRYYEPYLKLPGLLVQSLFAAGATGGSSVINFAAVELINLNGDLDYLADWYFSGYTAVVKEGTSGAAISSFAVIMTGTVEQPEFSLAAIRLRFKDRSLLLDSPVRTALYAGTNSPPDGLEGAADLKGTEKPRLFGTCANITPVCVNVDKRIYQFHDNAAASITGVRDNGAELTAGMARTLANLQANTPPDGSYDWCFDINGSYIRLGADPNGPVTMGAACSESFGAIVKLLALEKVPTVVQQSVQDLDNYSYDDGVDDLVLSAMSWGLYTGQRGMTTAAVLDRLCSMGIWWGFDNLGNFWAKQFMAPEGRALLELTTDEILTFERVATKDDGRGLAPARVSVRYKINDTVQANLLAAVYTDTPEAARYYESQYLTETVADTSLAANQPHSAELIITSVLQDQTAARLVADGQLNLRAGRCDRLKVSARLAALSYPTGGAWDHESMTELPAAAERVSQAVVGDYLYVVTWEGTAHKAYRLNLPLGVAAAWEVLSDPPSLFNFFQCSLVADNSKLYLIGAQKIYSFDTASPTNPWVDTGVTLAPVESSVAAYYGGYIWLVGGLVSGAESAKGYRISTSTWAISDANLADYPVAFVEGAGVLINNYWYVGGGRNISGNLTQFAVMNLDSPTVSWIPLNSLPVATRTHAFATTGFGGNVYCVGGGNKVYTYSTNTSSWSAEVTDLPENRYWCAALFYNASLYVLGGLTTGKSTLKLCTNANPADRAALVSLGRTVKVTYPRYGYDSGKYMRIIGSETDHAKRKISLELWGPIS